MGIDKSAIARTVGVEVEYRPFGAAQVFLLPQRVAVIGQGRTDAVFETTKRRVTTAQEVAERYGFGSPLHLAVRQLLPVNGDGVGTIPVTVYPLADDGSGVAATGTVTLAGSATSTQSYIIRAGGVDSNAFVVGPDDTVATVTAKITDAINGVLEMPVLPTDNGTDVSLSAKWRGESGNDIKIEVIGEDNGMNFNATAMTGGLVNPDVDTALNQVGDVWETMFVNCLNVDDTDTLDKYQTFGVGRWQPLVHKPAIFFSGTFEPDVNTAVTIPDARKTEYVNCQIPMPGAADLPLSIAARAVARIAKQANNDPATDYAGLVLDGLTPGTDGEQWNYAQRDFARKSGSSATQLRDGVQELSDTVTFYHPTGVALPEYSKVVTLVKLQNVVFNVALEFNSEKWEGKPLLNNEQSTTNPNARKPRDAVAAMAAIQDQLGLAAILTDTDTTKELITSTIDSQNPNRLNNVFPCKLSGNLDIIDNLVQFAFNFGEQPLV